MMDVDLFGLADHYTRNRLWAPATARRTSLQRRLARELTECKELAEAGDIDAAHAGAARLIALEDEIDRIDAEIAEARRPSPHITYQIARALMGESHVG